MLYTLLNDSRIVIGPREWHQAYFAHFVAQELNAPTATLPDSPPTEPVIFSETLRLVPTIQLYSEINPTFEELGGPRFYFDEDKNHIAEYYAQEFSLDTIKRNLKTQLSELRWNKEISPITRDINGKSLTLYTDRETRSIYAQALMLVPDDYSSEWKFPEGFYIINKSELKQIAENIIVYVQSCFDWEAAKTAEIDSIHTVEELRTYNLGN